MNLIEIAGLLLVIMMLFLAGGVWIAMTLAIVGWIAIEAVHRLMVPEAVKAIPMLMIAVSGLLVVVMSLQPSLGRERSSTTGCDRW